MVFECFDGIHDACFCPDWPGYCGLIFNFSVKKLRLNNNVRKDDDKGNTLPLHHNAIHNISIPEIGRLTARSVQILHGGSELWRGGRCLTAGRQDKKLAFE
jgi:hypothetical protein